MTAGLETFAKVRALHDRAATPGEKAAAASRMEALARSAGMSVADAVSKLDTDASRQPSSSFFDTPFFRQGMAERERERAETWRQVLAEYGSEKAVFAPGPWESALAEATERFVVRSKTTGWSIGSLWGWDGYSIEDPAPEIVSAISTAYPMPTNVRQAWAEFRFWEKLGRDREARGVACGDHAPAVQFRTVLIERLLNTLPAAALGDLRARLDWFDWRNDIENAPDPEEERERLATLRADIERMGAKIREPDVTKAPVQNGQGAGAGVEHPSPVQSGHPRRTNADKRRDVLTLFLNASPDGNSLTDREIARRVGVSPTTVGNIRRSLP